MFPTFILFILFLSFGGSAAETFSVGDFSVVQKGTFIQVCHISDKSRIVWQTLDEKSPFVKVGNASVPKPPILDGNFQMEEDIAFKTSWQTVNSVEMSESQSELIISGAVGSDDDLYFDYTFKMGVSTISSKYLHFDLQLTKPTSAVNRLFLSYWSDGKESFHGFGESFTDFDMNGRRIPILVSEQGVGRGTEPITTYLNKGTEGVGGHWYEPHTYTHS
jgi:hypothetical protein